VTVGPPLDARGYADPAWVEELYWNAKLTADESNLHHGDIDPSCAECRSLLEDSAQELLNRQIDKRDGLDCGVRKQKRLHVVATMPLRRRKK
jgi:hypothetical protein